MNGAGAARWRAVDVHDGVHADASSSLRKAERVLAERELLPHTKRPDTVAVPQGRRGCPDRAWSGRDDSLVAQHRLAKLYSPRPRLEIEIRPIEIAPAPA